jgi:hypothetical protein
MRGRVKAGVVLPIILTKIGKTDKYPLIIIPEWNNIATAQLNIAKSIPERYNSMWEIEKYAEFDKKIKKYVKRHRTEAKNALDNLAAYLGSLSGGMKPQQIVRGVHSFRGMRANRVRRKRPRSSK